MKKRAIHRNQPLPAHHQTPEGAQPGKGALDYKSATVAPELATVLQPWLGAIPPVRANQIDAALPLQSLSQRVTVVVLVGDQLDLRRRGGSKCASQRNTLAVYHHHPLSSLALFGLADAGPRFFAGAKLPSAKVSCHCKYCCSSS
jgi:hypothetical protein